MCTPPPFKCPRKDAWHNPGKDAWQNTVVVPTTRKSSTQAGGFSSKSSTQAGGFSSTRKEQHTQEFIFMLNSQTPIPLRALGGPSPKLCVPAGAVSIRHEGFRPLRSHQWECIMERWHCFTRNLPLGTISGCDAISGCDSCLLTRHPQHQRSLYR